MPNENPPSHPSPERLAAYVCPICRSVSDGKEGGTPWCFGYGQHDARMEPVEYVPASTADRLAEALEQIRDEYPWHVDGPGKIADEALRLYRDSASKENQ